MNRQLTGMIIFTLSLFISCSRDSNNSNVNVSDGTWHVSLFRDSGNDESGDFSGYSFQFAASGVLSAVKNGVSANGSWSRSSKFNIDLGEKSDSNKPLSELTDDWQIISISSSEIKLTDDNSSAAEFLTFTKN